MRIEIVEVRDPSRAAGRQPRRAEISGLHDDHHGLGHQRPAARRKSEPFADAQLPDGGNKLATSDRNAPAMLAAVHVDGDDAAEWRFEQWCPARTRQISELADEIV